VVKLSLRTKDYFPFLEDKIYFNCAAQGVVPESTIKIFRQYIEDYCNSMRGKEKVDYSDVKTNSKKLFAEIIGAKVSEIAFVPNATTGINTAFSMIPFKKGENVVLSDLSYPMGATIVTGYQRKGVETKLVEHQKGVVRLINGRKR